MKRILVTGSTGFVGSNVVEKLVKKKYEVIAHGRTVKPWTPKCVTDRLIEIDFDKEKYELGEFDAVVNCLSVINPKDYSWEEFEYPNCSITYSISKKYLVLSLFIYRPVPYYQKNQYLLINLIQ